MPTNAVVFEAEIRQVKTMADHTVNVTLNLPEYCAGQAAEIMLHVGDMVKLVGEFTEEQQQNGRK